jgi:electron transfer flavoprotein beta subunit
VPLELNAFDRYAVQHAARLADEVVVMTMGPPQAEEALREALGLGAHRAIHLSDRVFAVADTLGTSRTLALGDREGRRRPRALRPQGARLRDLAGAAAGRRVPRLAARRRTRRVERSGDALRLTRETDFGEEVYEADLPLVVSVGRRPRVAAGDRRREITSGRRPTSSTTSPNDKRFGQTGSPTRVLAVRDSRPERAGIRARAPRRRRAGARAARRARARGPSWDKPEHIAEEPGASYDCWSVCELVDGSPRGLARADRPQPRASRESSAAERSRC